ncbi:hypothetical protein H5U98_22785 [Mycolicibacterium boenickei]|uniref:Uncharacterized protein n=1 Tax=Mycolicibacterium boenickei TaxID=146017 RepID=A0AAX2ZTN5_9MYCO|nr:hypothetical protein [Mycolicibacterium boenickei]UNB98353.1 hypothetical protein H5U98_22785 [Mycolicibacterium boenickei]BBX94142.1 hypothetical protein MBOE_57910 [Mycolicibacterium boenickei]
MEFAEGAFVRLRVPLPADTDDSARSVLTDIDVLSIDVDNRLRVETSSYESKGGAGQKGEPYTLVWLAGFRQLLRLDRVAIMRQTISVRGRNLARQLGITAIDVEALTHREQGHAWIPERFAHVDGEHCTIAETRTDVQLKGLPDVPLDLTRFLRGHGVLSDAPALLSAVAQLGRASELQGVLPEPASQVLAGHALLALILAATRDAGQIDSLGQTELRARRIRALTTGDENDVFLLPLLERADSLVRYYQEKTHRAYTAAGADAIRIDVPSLRDAIAQPPPYIDDYMDFVARLRANPVVARELLQTAELACFEAILGGSAWKAPAFAHLFTAEHRGLLLVSLRCLRQVGGEQVALPLERLVDLPFHAGLGQLADRHSAMQPSDESTGEGAAG